MAKSTSTQCTHTAILTARNKFFCGAKKAKPPLAYPFDGRKQPSFYARGQESGCGGVHVEYVRGGQRQNDSKEKTDGCDKEFFVHIFSMDKAGKIM